MTQGWIAVKRPLCHHICTNRAKRHILGLPKALASHNIILGIAQLSMSLHFSLPVPLTKQRETGALMVLKAGTWRIINLESLCSEHDTHRRNIGILVVALNGYQQPINKQEK
jgi:hypothetical protein